MFTCFPTVGPWIGTKVFLEIVKIIVGATATILANSEKEGGGSLYSLFECYINTVCHIRYTPVSIAGVRL